MKSYEKIKAFVVNKIIKFEPVWKTPVKSLIDLYSLPTPYCGEIRLVEDIDECFCFNKNGVWQKVS